MSDDISPDVLDDDSGQWVRRGATLYWRAFKRPGADKGGRPALPQQCGTERGYQQHRWRYRNHSQGTWPLPADDPCGCKAAHAAHVALRKQMRRAG